MKTYSLAEVAAIALPKPPELKEPERWLRRHLNDGRIKGYKVGRIWRMKQEHLNWLVDTYLSNEAGPADVPAVAADVPDASVSILAGLSERGRASVLRNQRTA